MEPFLWKGILQLTTFWAFQKAKSRDLEIDKNPILFTPPSAFFVLRISPLAKKMQKLVYQKFNIIPQPECELVGSKIGDLSIDELIKLQKSKKYKPSFIWRVIRSHGKESLKDYGQKMEYSSGWVYRQEQQINDNMFCLFFYLRLHI